MRLRKKAVKALAQLTRRVHPRGTFHLLLRLHRPDKREWFLEEIVTMDGGLRVRANTSSFVEWLVYFLGTYEPDVAELIRRSIRPGHSAVDVGANVGFHTLTMATAVGQGRVLACEPNPKTRDRLLANLALNNLRNVAVHQVAVVEKPGEVTLFVPDPSIAWGTNQGTASLQLNHPFLSETLEIKVPGVTLDDLVATEGLSDVDLVKIDVEGFEGAVLAGATKLLARDRPTLVFEYRKEYWDKAGYSYEGIVGTLKEAGYVRFAHITRKGLEPVPSPVPTYMNLFVTS